MREIPLKQITVWKEAQARKLDRENISELVKSIKNDGLLNPPLVQKISKNEYLLMSGQRRLAAMKRLHAKKMHVHVLKKHSEMSLEEAKAASVVENIHRNDMHNRDIIDAATILTERMGKLKAAKHLGITYFTLNKYLGFAGVPDRIKDLVPRTISRDEATKLYQAVPNIAKATRIAERITKLDSPSRKRYLRVLASSPKSSHKTILKRMKKIAIRQKIPITLSKTNARKLNREAVRRDTDAAKLANELVAKWLKKR